MAAAFPLPETGPRPPRFAVVTPCRNEETHIEATIQTIATQTVRPDLWVIVDDGSSDRTPALLEAAARAYPYIKVVRRPDRGMRKVGSGVVDAFYSGLEQVNLDEFQFICKLDADLELPPRYFERVLEEMTTHPRLGNFSGKVYLRLEDGRLVAERMGDENAVGAAKFYRVSCFRDIGGFVREVGWDGIDGHMCRLKGWNARSLDEEELRIVHRRMMGSSEVNVWHGRKRWGRTKWFQGSALYYVAAVALYRAVERPFVVGAAGILWGYLEAMLTGMPRFEHPGFRREIRRFERKALLFGKARAMARPEATDTTAAPRSP
jgi:glycosyltransferase involved in cell wall biosynthesis